MPLDVDFRKDRLALDGKKIIQRPGGDVEGHGTLAIDRRRTPVLFVGESDCHALCCRAGGAVMHGDTARQVIDQDIGLKLRPVGRMRFKGVNVEAGHPMLDGDGVEAEAGTDIEKHIGAVLRHAPQQKAALLGFPIAPQDHFTINDGAGIEQPEKPAARRHDVTGAVPTP